MIAELERHVRESWAEIAPQQAPPRQLHALKLGGDDYPPPTSAMVVLFFPDRSSTPCAVTKVARTPEADPLVEHEAALLQQVRGCLPADLLQVVPRPLCAARVNGRAFLLTTALRGELEPHYAWDSARVRRCEGTIGSALRWAWRLAAARPSGSIGLAEWLGAGAPEEVLALFRERSWTGSELDRLGTRLQPVWGHRWPAGLGHGDFWSGNLLFEGERVAGVFDWSMADLRAPIFADAMTYELSFSHNRTYTTGHVDARRSQQIHALRPFVELRGELLERGIDAGISSDARLAALLVGALGDRGMSAARERAARAYAQLLRAELGLPLGADRA